MDPLLTYFEKNWSQVDITYISEHHILKFNEQNHTRLKSILDEENIRYRIAQKKIEIEKESLPFSFFIDFSEFCQKVKECDLNKDMFIPDYQTQKMVFCFDSNEIYIDGIIDESNSLISNSRDYFLLINFLIAQSKKLELESLVDFHDEFNNIFHINSYSKEGSLKIQYPSNGIPLLTEKSNLANNLSELNKTLNNEGSKFLKFLRSALVKKTPSNKNNIVYILYNLEDILSEAQINFGVYINEFSLDKLKSEYRQYKKQFFEDQNIILKNISTSLLSLPISVVGSVFAVHKLQGNDVGLTIIVGGIWLFSIYYSFLISVYYTDLISIKKNVLKDFKQIKQNEFFRNHKEELEDFKRTKKLIKERIESLTNGMWYYHLSIWGSTIVLSLFALDSILSLKLASHMFIFLFLFSFSLAASHYWVFNSRTL